MRVTDFEYVTEFDGFPDRKVLLIGMMEDGPVGRAFTMNTREKVNIFLGENEVTDAYHRLLDTGVPADNILFYRLNGDTSQAILNTKEGTPAIEFRTLTANNADNNIEIVVSEQGLSVLSNYSEETLIQSKRKNFSRSYLFEDYPTTADLADAFTNDAMLGLTNVIASPLLYLESRDAFLESDVSVFYDGNTEESLVHRHGDFPDNYHEQYWESFYKTILNDGLNDVRESILLEYPVEVYYFVDYPFSGSEDSKNILKLAASIAEEKTVEQILHTTALFRTAPIPEKRLLFENEYLLPDGTFFNEETQEIEEYDPDRQTLSFILEIANSFTEEEREDSFMRNLQVVVGEDSLAGGLTPASTDYLALLLTENIHSPITNKPLANFNQVRTPLSKYMIDTLQSKGYICSVPSIRKNVVVTKGQSMYTETNNIMDSFYHMKLIKTMGRDIGLLVDRYIGKPKSSYLESNIQDEIEDYLSFYLETSALSDYKVELINDGYSPNESGIHISLSFYGEIHTIETTIQMSDEGWAIDLWNINN